MKDVAGNETQGEKHTLRLFVHIRGMENHICRLFSSLAEVDVGRGDSFFFLYLTLLFLLWIGISI